MNARVVLALSLVLAACTSPSTGGDMSAIPSVDLARPYPAGPYGNQIGSTLPPLVWEGYAADQADVLVSTRPYGAYAIDDARRSGRRYGFIHVSDFI